MVQNNDVDIPDSQLTANTGYCMFRYEYCFGGILHCYIYFIIPGVEIGGLTAHYGFFKIM